MAFPFYVYNIAYPAAGFKSQTHVYCNMIAKAVCPLPSRFLIRWFPLISIIKQGIASSSNGPAHQKQRSDVRPDGTRKCVCNTGCIYSFGFYADSGKNGSCTREYEDWIEKNTPAAIRYKVLYGSRIFHKRYRKGTKNDFSRATVPYKYLFYQLFRNSLYNC